MLALLVVAFYTFLCSYECAKLYPIHQNSKDPHILKLNANPGDFLDSTWIMFIKHENNYKEDDNTTIVTILEPYLAEDECIILKLTLGGDGMNFKIYCNKTATDEITTTPPFQRALETFIYPHYEQENVHVTKEMALRVRESLGFYGTPDILKYAMQMNRGLSPHPNDRIQHIPMPRKETQQRITRQNLFENPAPWALDRIDQRVGLLDNTFQYMNMAPDVDIYVLDTGIRVTHQEFQGRATFLFNAVGDNVDTDCAGHGTFCASEIVGATVGVAKHAKVYGVKILDCLGNGDLFSIQSGIMAVIDQARANTSRRAIASLSLGGGKSTLLDNAVNSLALNGITVVVSAGNEGANSCLYSPSNLGGDVSKSIITVGASDINDDAPVWSNYGSCVTLSAPGVNLVGAWYTGDTATHVLSGTSMSCPLVSGVAALILQQNPTLTPHEVKSAIVAWATPGIVAFTSADGGGKNLLYSMVDTSQSLPSPTPSPTDGGFVPPILFNSGSSFVFMALVPCLSLLLHLLL